MIKLSGAFCANLLRDSDKILDKNKNRLILDKNKNLIILDILPRFCSMWLQQVFFAPSASIERTSVKLLTVCQNTIRRERKKERERDREIEREKEQQRERGTERERKKNKEKEEQREEKREKE